VSLLSSSGLFGPLHILREFLSSLGHPETTIRSTGTELRFRHLIAFFLGRPVLQPNSIARSEILIANCDVRRGRLVHRWSRHKCLLYNGSLRIQKGTGEDDVMSLSRCRVDVWESRRGRCLRVQHSASVILLHFDEPEVCALVNGMSTEWATECMRPERSEAYTSSGIAVVFGIVPEEILTRLPHLAEWALAGNYIENMDIDEPVHIMKVTLAILILVTKKNGMK
ncbi:hypothetical protein OSTOST_23361, partial [Ostertagia ostertagi]